MSIPPGPCARRRPNAGHTAFGWIWQRLDRGKKCTEASFYFLHRVITIRVDARGQTALITLPFHVRLMLGCTIIKWKMSHFFTKHSFLTPFSKLTHCAICAWKPVYRAQGVWKESNSWNVTMSFAVVALGLHQIHTF